MDLIVRISVFVGIFAVMAVWEMIAPRCQGQRAKAKRWGINLALMGFNTLFTRALGLRCLGGSGAGWAGRGGPHPSAEWALVDRNSPRDRLVRFGGVFSACAHACRSHFLATAHGASFRYGFRCDHWRAVSSARNRFVDVHQDRSRYPTGRITHGRAHVRNSSECHRHV